MARTQTNEMRHTHGAATAERTRPPSVLVVLVSHDGAQWLRRCLAALSKQTHPRIGVVAVDNASTDGSAELLDASLGPERVIRLRENRGFAAGAAAGLRTEAGERADYVLLLHDDTLLAPEAVANLVEAAERMDGVGVVGPKMLDTEDPTVLREVGLSADRFGNSYSPLEHGEIDQGQYDRVREVFYVSSSAMLVSRAVIERVGPPDERFVDELEDMDLCWRARIGGFRVLWTPTAVALHPADTRRDRRGGPGARAAIRYHRERAAVASMLKNYGLVSLLWVLPATAVQGLIRILYFALSRRFGDALQVAAAWGWNVIHMPSTLRRRVRAQSVRSVRDHDVRRFMAPAWIRFGRSMRSFSEGLRAAAGVDVDPERRTTLSVRVRRLAAAHPVAGAWILAALLAAMAYRHLAGASPLSGGALAAFPSSPSGFFAEFFSGIRHTALGGGAPASPSLPMLGVLSTLTFGSPALAQKALLLVLPAAAAVGCYRALRSLPVGRVAAVLGAACYALSSLSLWSLSQGRLPESVFLAGLPWLVTRLVQAFTKRPPADDVRWVVGAALGIATLAAFLPGALLAVPVVLAVGFVIPDGTDRVRGLARAGLAVAVAVALAFPVIVGVVGSHGFGLADPVGHPSFLSALRLSIGSAPGAWRVAFFLPIAAALGLAFVSGPLGRPALRALVLALAGVYLTWAAGAWWLPSPLANPVVFAGLAAFAMCTLAAVGLESVLTDLPRASFGYRHLGSITMIGVIGAGLIGQTFQAARGAWDVGGAERVPAAYSVVAGSHPAPSRVLWLGRRVGGALPAPAGGPQGEVTAGASSLRYTVAGPVGAAALDFGRSANGKGYDQLERAVAAIVTGPTRHAGALLAAFGVAYIVAGQGDLPPAVALRLSQQVDLIAESADTLLIYRDPVAPPLQSLVSDPAWLAAITNDERSRHLLTRSEDLQWITQLAPAHTPPLARRGDVFSGTAPGSQPSLVLLSQQFDARWRLTYPDGTSQGAAPAFGWADRFTLPAGAGPFTVRFTGQAARSAQMTVLSILWLAALWITRRPSRAY
jgi:GT2 family glycosyltransferase